MDQKKMMRRWCNRVGLAMLIYLVVVNTSLFMIQIIVQRIYPEALYHSDFAMFLNDLCAYPIGGLFFYLVIRRMPEASVPQRSVTPLRMGKLALESIGAMYGANLLTIFIVGLISSLSGFEMGNLLDSAAEDMSIGSMFIFMVLIAPVCEEFMFRRVLFRRLLPMGQPFAVAISALVFGLFHNNLYQFFYAVALGVLFGCIVAKTGRIRYTVALHALLNFIGSVLTMLTAQSDVVNSAFAVAIYLFMIAGIILLLLDRKALIPAEPSVRGCWGAAFTSPAFLAYIVISGILSVAIMFFV